MVTLEQRKMIKEKSYHGFMAEVARKEGITLQLVSNWFRGKSKSKKVEIAVLDLFLQNSLKEQAILKRLKLK